MTTHNNPVNEELAAGREVQTSQPPAVPLPPPGPGLHRQGHRQRADNVHDDE